LLDDKVSVIVPICAFLFQNPITVEVFSEDKNLLQKVGGKRITFTPLAQDELPKKVLTSEFFSKRKDFFSCSECR
jgi:hypothetical protein